MTRFEEYLKAILDTYNGVEIDTEAAVKLHAPTLLGLAKSEFENDNQSNPIQPLTR